MGAITVKTKKTKSQPQKGQFATHKEAAQAKTADLMKTLKGIDLSSLTNR